MSVFGDKIRIRYNPVDQDVGGIIKLGLVFWIVITLIFFGVSGFAFSNIVGSVILAFPFACLITWLFLVYTGYEKIN